MKSGFVVRSTISSWDSAERFCRQFSLPLLDMQAKHNQEVFQLIFDHQNVHLLDCRAKKPLTLMVDFVTGSRDHRRKFGGGAGQAVAKAVGVKGNRTLHVLDATAGLGGDAFVLACLGSRVTMIERSPVAYALLADGLKRGLLQAEEAGDDELLAILQRMTLVPNDGSDWMRDQLASIDIEQPDVVYLDPMFPEKSKKALAKKEMQIFQEVVGGDEDADKLFEPALALAKYRVVVKRPKIAPLLNGQEPSVQLVGKSSRFDVYAKKKLPE